MNNNQIANGLLALGACLALLLCCFASISTAQNTFRQPKQLANCTNIQEVLDQCGAQASFSFTMATSQYPTTAAELREACQRTDKGLDCLRKHVKCLKKLTKNAMVAFIEGRRKHVRSICSQPDQNSQASRDFVALFACIKKHKKQKFVQSEIMAIRRIEALLSDQVKDFKERFQRSCCAISTYRQQSIDDLGKECGSPAMITAYENAIDSVVGEAVEFACPDPKTGYCQKYKELRLSTGPVTKTLTRAGTDLLMVITEPDDGSQTLPPKDVN